MRAKPQTCLRPGCPSTAVAKARSCAKTSPIWEGRRYEDTAFDKYPLIDQELFEVVEVGGAFLEGVVVGFSVVFVVDDVLDPFVGVTLLVVESSREDVEGDEDETADNFLLSSET